MVSKRLPNEQSLEDLLKTIEESEEKNIVGVSDDVFSFITHFNILPGEELVLKSVLYDLYCSWSKTPISKFAFGSKAAKYFLNHQKGPRNYLKINLNSISIQKETILNLEKNKLNKIKYPTWQAHYNQFLNFYKIKKGNSWVQSYVLMHFYDKWCYKNKRRRLLSEVSFFNFCKLHFEYKRNTESRMMWFKVNKEFIDEYLSPQKLTHLQQGRERTHGKKQKRKNKIPSIKT
jgi:hypothetical protein